MHRNVPTTYKPPCSQDEQIFKIVRALQTRAIKRNRIVPFPEVNRVLSWFHFRKRDREELLYNLKEQGLIEIVAYHGIVLREDEEL